MKKLLFKLMLVFILVFSLTLGCLITLENKDSTVKATEITSPKLEIYKKNISYASEIYIMYAVSYEGIDASVNPIKMLFFNTVQDEYTTTNAAYVVESTGSATISGVACKIFSSKGLAAKQMTDDIYTRAYVEIDSEVVYSEVVKYSVLDYYYEVKEAGTVAANILNLLEAMVNYGAAAQINFNYNTDRLANATYYKVNVDGGYLEDGFTYGRYQENDSITITAKEKVNEEFVCWINSKSNVVSTDVTYTFNLTQNDSFTALYKILNTKYYVNYYIDNVLTYTDEYQYNETIELRSNEEKEGYTFSGWSEIPSTMPANDINVYGTFSPITYKITYNLNGAVLKGDYNNKVELVEDFMKDLNTFIAEKQGYALNAETGAYEKTSEDGSVSTYVPLETPYLPVGSTADDAKNAIGGTSGAWYNATLSTLVGSSSSAGTFVGDEKMWTKWSWLFEYMNIKLDTVNSAIDMDTRIVDAQSNWSYIMWGYLANAPLISGWPSSKVDWSGETELPNTYVKPNGNITEYTCEMEYTFKDIERYEYNFLGWYDSNDNLITSLEKGTIGDLDLYAKWDPLFLIDEQFKYSFDFEEEKVLISQYVGENKEIIIIPEYVVFDGKTYTDFTFIGNLFSDCTNLTSITIPSSVISIGKDAFYKCSSLTNIYYEGTIESWCNISFSSNTSNPMSYADYFYMKNEEGNWYEVTEIVIPNTITKLGNYQFYGFENITNITIPKGIISIGSDTFSNCSNLTNVYYEGTIESWCNFSFISQYNTPMLFANHFYIKNEKGTWYELTEIIIPNTINKIGDYQFYGFENVTRITIPSSVTSIASFAFYHSTAEIIWDNPTITEIGEFAFSGYRGTNIIIPSSVTSIGSSAFSSCTAEIIWDNPTITKIDSKAFAWYVGERITIPSSVTSIASFAFEHCTAEIIWDNPVITEIGAYVFQNYGGTSITIPSSVISIEYRAFYDCSSLTNIYYEGTIESWCNISFNFYYSNPMYYADYFYMKNEEGNWYEVTEIVIPDTITEIGNYQFYRFENVTSITIPEGVTSIGSSAFAHCSNLTSITILDSVTSIDSDAFYECRSLTIYYDGTSIPTGWNSNWNPNNRPLIYLKEE